MKKVCLSALPIIIIFSILSGCAAGSRRHEPVELPDFAYVDRMFSAEGNIYAIRSAGERSYITTEFSNTPVCYPLSALSGGQCSDAVRHAKSGRLYYSEGYGIYSCDLTGNEKQLFWELPKGSKKDFVNIAAASDDFLFVKAGYGKRQSALHSLPGEYLYTAYDYYSLNVTTGQALPIFSGVPYYKLPIVICDYNNTILAVQLTGRESYNPILENKTLGPETAHVLRADLRSGEVEELGLLDTTGTISYVDGVVLDDRLYFICERSGLYSVPLSGGSIERLSPDTARVPGMDLYIQMEEYGGEVYILLWDGVTYPPSALCKWAPETGLLLPVAETDSSFSATGFFIDSGTYFLFEGSEIRAGEIAEKAA